VLRVTLTGRVRMPKDRREAILDAFERSGMSGQAFAAHIGVKYPTFATWVQKRRRSRGDYKSKQGKRKRAGEVTLFEAAVDSEATTTGGALKVETAHGLKLRIGSRAEVALAAELLQALEKRAKGPLFPVFFGR